MVCRNVLIYFRQSAQARATETFAFALKRGALLWLGSSESIASDLVQFDTLDHKWRIFRAVGPKPPARLSRIPSKSLRGVNAPPSRFSGDRDARGLRNRPSIEAHFAIGDGFVPPTLSSTRN